MTAGVAQIAVGIEAVAVEVDVPATNSDPGMIASGTDVGRRRAPICRR